VISNGSLWLDSNSGDWSLREISRSTPVSVTLEDIKLYLRLLGTDSDDAELSSFIRVAEDFIRIKTGHCLPSSSFELNLPWLSRRVLTLPVYPVTAITSFQVLNPDTETYENVENYRTSLLTIPATISPKAYAFWPAQYRFGPFNVRIVFNAGYTGSGFRIPDTLTHCVKMLVAHYYESRNIVSFNPVVNMVPYTLKSMLDSLTIVRRINT
jgi:uncharacterized phiE125 gp8 family phage protein